VFVFVVNSRRSPPLLIGYLQPFEITDRTTGSDWLPPFKFGGSMTAAAETGQ
jgi:hypothetical protein